MSNSRPQLRSKVYAASSSYGFARTADKIVRDGIVDTGAFLDGSAIAFDGKNVYQYRPALTGGNRVKMGLVVEGSTWVHAQGPYTDALTDKNYEAVGFVHPDDFNEAIRLALREVYFEMYWPLGPWLDNDFASSSLTAPYNWTAAAANTVPTKVTTGGVSTQAGQTGPRNLVTTNTSSNGYVPTSDYYVEPGDQFVNWFIGRANGSFTGQYILWDLSHGAALETIQFQSRNFQQGFTTTTIPAGCRAVEVRLGGVESNAAIEWDCIGGHILDARTFVLPDYVLEQFQLLSFGPAAYGRNTSSAKLSNAESRMIEAWNLKSDFKMIPEDEAATARTLQVNRPGGMTAQPFWVEVKRPYSSVDELIDETGTTNAPEDYLMAAVWFHYFNLLHNSYKDAGGNSEWAALRDAQKRILDGQRRARPASLPIGEKTFYVPGGRRGTMRGGPYQW